MTSTSSRLLVLALVAATSLAAATIGTNPPAEPINAERIAKLPAAQQAVWKDYLARSEKMLAGDKAFFQAELKANNITTPLVPAPPPRGGGPGPGGGRGQTRDAAWYGGPDALRMATNMITFQTPGGGWSKNLDFTRQPRRPGELFAGANLAPVESKVEDNDRPHDAAWHYIATFDNGSTITPLKFLVQVAAAADAEHNAPIRKSVLLCLEYIFAAQFPNGGWPQVYPLEGGYHDGITYNDDAMMNILGVLRDVVAAKNEYAWIPVETRNRAAASIQRARECILVTQIKVGGKLTAWCQQHDALTLGPTSARNYEMRSQTPAESAGIILFLMDQANPDPREIAAVHAAAAWLQKTAIYGKALKNVPGEGRQIADAEGAGPLWPRYVEIGTDRPLFGDRDKSIHDTMSEISAERRNGYSWYNATPTRALEVYANWKKTH